MATDIPASITKGIGRLTEQRVVATDLAARLKTRAHAGELGAATLEEARTYYVQGQAAIDGWIRHTALLAQTGDGAQALGGAEEALGHAIARAYAFVDFATNAMSGDQTMGFDASITADLSELVDSLLEAGTSIAQGVLGLFRSRREDERRRLAHVVAALEQLRWPSFEEVAGPGPDHAESP